MLLSTEKGLAVQSHNLSCGVGALNFNFQTALILKLVYFYPRLQVQSFSITTYSNLGANVLVALCLFFAEKENFRVKKLKKGPKS